MRARMMMPAHLHAAYFCQLIFRLLLRHLRGPRVRRLPLQRRQKGLRLRGRAEDANRAAEADTPGAGCCDHSLGLRGPEDGNVAAACMHSDDVAGNGNVRRGDRECACRQ